MCGGGLLVREDLTFIRLKLEVRFEKISKISDRGFGKFEDLKFVESVKEGFVGIDF